MMIRLSTLLILLVGFLGFIQAAPLSSSPELYEDSETGLYPRQPGQCRVINQDVPPQVDVQQVGRISIDYAIIHRYRRVYYPNNFLTVVIDARRLSRIHPFIDIEITNTESRNSAITLTRREFGSRTYNDIVSILVPKRIGENKGEMYICLQLFKLSGHFYISA